jgi:ribosomal-protein-alanine N-acetyltransferase
MYNNIEIKIVPLNEKHLSDCNIIDSLSFESPWSPKEFERELSNAVAHYFVAEHNGKAIGYGGYWWVFDEAQITNIAVHPDYRQKGVAQAILDKMVNSVNDGFVKTMTLEVRKSNLPAQNLYKKNGFKEVGIRPKYYNHTEDAVLMTKEIESID